MFVLVADEDHIDAEMDPDKQNEKHKIIERLLVTPWVKVNSSLHHVALNAVGLELYLTLQIQSKSEKQT